MTETFAPGESFVVRHVWRGNTFLVWSGIAVLSDEVAAGVRAEAERVIAADSFPTGWEDWELDPSWPVPGLPADVL